MSTIPSAGNDTLTGTIDADTLEGLGGNDTILGLGADDVLAGGEGRDSILGGDGNDSITGGGADAAGRDFLDGSDGNDTLVTSDGGFGALLGGAGNDSIVAGASGVETGVGGAGNDTLIGSAGTDYLVGDDNDIFGAPGSTVSGRDVIDGGDGADLLSGGPGDDILSPGNSGPVVTQMDSLQGGDGEDTLALPGTPESYNVFVDGFGNTFVQSNGAVSGANVRAVLDGIETLAFGVTAEQLAAGAVPLTTASLADLLRLSSNTGRAHFAISDDIDATLGAQTVALSIAELIANDLDPNGDTLTLRSLMPTGGPGITNLRVITDPTLITNEGYDPSQFPEGLLLVTLDAPLAGPLRFTYRTEVVATDRFSGESDTVIGSTATVTLDPGPLPPPPTIAFTTGNAGSNSEASGALFFSLQRVGDLTLPSTVDLRLSGTVGPFDIAGIRGATQQADPAVWRVSFIGNQEFVDLEVLVLDDIVVEPDETVTLTLENPVGAALSGTLVATGTILDNDTPPPLPTASLDAATAGTVNEGNNASPGFNTPLEFTIRRSGDLSQAGTVTFVLDAASGSTLTAADIGLVAAGGNSLGSGFGPFAANFAAGEETRIISVFATGDSVPEADEAVRLTLTGGTGATLSATGVLSATGTFANDDTPPASPVPTPGNDLIDGTSGADSINALAGDDTVNGLDGNDQLVGGAGDDTLDGGSGDDDITGNTGDDSLVGGTGDDNLRGRFGADTLDGGAGDDRLSGFDQDDLLFGDAGRDTIDGGAGRDTINGGDDADLLRGGLDDDLLLGGAGTDELRGGQGADTVDGGANDDLVVGAAGADFLRGGADDGSLAVFTRPNGTLGAIVSGGDVLQLGIGGAGDGAADTVGYAVGEGVDRIRGFERGSDVLSIQLGAATATLTTIGASTYITFAGEAGGLVIEGVTGLQQGTDIIFT